MAKHPVNLSLPRPSSMESQWKTDFLWMEVADEELVWCVHGVESTVNAPRSLLLTLSVSAAIDQSERAAPFA